MQVLEMKVQELQVQELEVKEPEVQIKRRKKIRSRRSRRRGSENLIPLSSWEARMTYGWLVPQVEVCYLNRAPLPPFSI